MIKSFIEEKAQGIVLKLCLSIVCVSILIFSLFQLGYAFQVWAAQYKDAFQMSCALFFSTMALSLLGLYFLFGNRKAKTNDVESDVMDIAHPFIGMSLQEKGFVFIRGLIDGILNGRSYTNR